MRAGGWVPKLPGAAWLVLGGDALSSVGTGMSMPFLVVYLHNVRGISIGAAGAAASTIALAGFVGNPFGGWLADRIGPRKAVVIGLVIAGMGAIGYSLVRETWHAFPAAAVSGLGIAIVWPAQSALLANLVSPTQRPTVFSVRHGTMNAGLAVGGLVAAAIVQDGAASRFVLLYVVDAATYLVFIPVLLAIPAAGRRVVLEDGDEPTPGGWRVVFADRVFRRVWVLSAVVIAVGYAQFNASFPAFATREGGIPAGTIGLVFAANTVAVVGLQLVTLRLVKGWRRTTSFALTCACWAAAWVITLVAGTAGGGTMAAVLFGVVAVVFGIGETFLSPSVGPIVNDLAPDDLRGRYNGLYTLAWTTGFAVGPVAGGFVLSADRPGWLFGTAASVCVVLAFAGLRLAALLPDRINVIADDEDVPQADGAVAAMAGEVV